MRPIFVSGVDRSGTTMLGSLLASIPDSIVTPESLFKTSIKPCGYKTRKAYIEALTSSPLFSAWMLQNVSLPEDGTDRSVLESLVSSFAGRPVSHWIDHSPNNLVHIRYLTSIFPEAKFIHIIRDGRAVASSIMPLEWGPNTAIACAKTWVSKISHCFAAESVYPRAVKSVYYEDLVDDPVTHLNNIFEFLELDFSLKSKADIKVAGNLVRNETKSQHAKVGQLPDAANKNKWRTTLTPKEISDYEFYAGEMLTLLGYTLVTGGKRPSKLHLAISFTKELCRKKILNPRKYRCRRQAKSIAISP